MKLRVAVVGLGKQGRKHHIPGLLAAENAELVAVCDIDESRVNELSTSLNVNGYNSVEELLNKESLDFIVIATPHDTHKEIINLAASKGVNIFKEKPFAKNLAEALEIVKIVEENKIELMVVLERRFSAIYPKFFEYIETIGKPSFIDIKHSIFAENPHPNWRASLLQAGGGCILDMGYHMIDLLLWYFGLPDSIYSNYSTISKNDQDNEVEDSASIVFDYKSGCVGNMHLSRFNPPKTEYVKVIGQKGILEVSKEKITLYGANGEVIESIAAKSQSDELCASKQIDHFCEILNGKRENVSNSFVNLNHMLFIESCYQSRKERRIVDPQELIQRNLITNIK